jgi:hypothetical protein
MIKLEELTASQAEVLAGGNGYWAFPSLTSKTSTQEINNFVSQSNSGSAWASSTTASAGGGFGLPHFHLMPTGGSSAATANNSQTNTNSVTNWVLGFTI